MPKKTVKLKANRDAPIRAGHPWIFSNALAEAEDCRTGDVVQVRANDGSLVGTGTFHAGMSIRVRMLSVGRTVTVNTGFLTQRLAALRAWKLRELGSQTTGYRLVHGDADYLPGLVVDVYADVAVFQIHTAGMETFRDAVIASLRNLLQPSAIVERSDVESRSIERLKDRPPALVYGELPEQVRFVEAGISYLAEPLSGQKTGFFLDQRDGRALVRSRAEGKRVWDLFSYSGAAGVAAAVGGAAEVWSVDVSNAALETARRMFSINGFDPDSGKFRFVESRVDEFLSTSNEAPGLIVCDPPAFAKHRADAEAALQGYTALNRACFERLASGGTLVSSSCSGVITTAEFHDMLRMAAGRAGRNARIIAELAQPVDHTRRLAFPEGAYLKTAVMEID